MVHSSAKGLGLGYGSSPRNAMMSHLWFKTLSLRFSPTKRDQILPAHDPGNSNPSALASEKPGVFSLLGCARRFEIRDHSLFG